MNLAYFRNSTFDLTTTCSKLEAAIAKTDFKLLEKVELTSGGVVYQICRRDWLDQVLGLEVQLLGLVPCSIAVIPQASAVKVGVGSPGILSSVAPNSPVSQLASQMETQLKDLIHAAAGVGALQPVKVKLFSTMTCPYCKMEAQWLTEHKVKFEEIHVDLDQKAAQEMVAKTGQMGVPVTSVSYSDGSEEFIVGFDKTKLEPVIRSLI